MLTPLEDSSPTRRKRSLLFGAFFALILFTVLAARVNSATLYDATNSTGVTQDTVHYLQQVTMGPANEYYTITGFSAFGVHTTDPGGLRRARLVINFYTGVNLDPNASNPLADAVLIGQQIYSAAAAVPDALIGINFDQPFLAPRTFAIEISLRMEDDSTWSDIMTGRFTLAAPIFGSSTGFVWSDENRDGLFTSAERTTFGGTVGNIRVKVVGVAANPPLQLTAAVSRKTHGAAGSYDVNLPLSTQPGIECRSGGGNGDHTLVFTFSRSVLSGSAAVTNGTGSVSGAPAFSGNTMTVPLTGVQNAQRLTVTLSNVTDSNSQVLPDTPVTIGFLLGDTTGNGSVTSTDISQTKAESGHAVNGSNFRTDVLVSGAISSSDVIATKSNTGTSVSPTSNSAVDMIIDTTEDVR
jgi:hypothetical protein